MSVVLDFTNEITATFAQPFNSGGSVTAEVPSKYPCALNGRPYMIDTQVEHTFTDYWNDESIPLIRAQADPSSFPREASLNPESLWRRFQDSAHHGAGQVYLDRDDSADPYRYYTSKGIDPWTRYKVQLLPDTDQKRSSSNTNLLIVVAGSRVYIADGQSLRYSTDITPDTPTFTAVTGTNASSITGLASDGTNVYAAFGNGIGKTDTSTGAITDAWNALVAGPLAYVKGRLMAVGATTNAYKLYNVTAAGAAPSVLFTHPNTAFVFVGFAEGTNNIYAAGYSGDKSIIYRMQVKADGTALDTPVVAATLPDGEIVRGIEGYLGFVMIGSDKGFRLAEEDTNGNLTYGPLVATTSAVSCFEPQAQYVWYGLTNFDGTSTGLGRMDITTFTQTLTPAYASDLMVTGQGATLSVVTFQNIRFFALSALGFYAEATTKVSTGNLRTGLISYGIPDNKTSLFLNVNTEPLTGSVQAEIADDNSAFVSIGTNSTATTTFYQYNTSQTIGQHFEIRLTLNRDGSDTTSGPIIERWTLKAFPTLGDGNAVEIQSVPLLLYSKFDVNGIEQTLNVASEKALIKTLRTTRQIVTLQILSESSSGFVDDYRWVPHHLTYVNGQWDSDGTMVIKFKRVQ